MLESLSILLAGSVKLNVLPVLQRLNLARCGLCARTACADTHIGRHHKAVEHPVYTRRSVMGLVTAQVGNQRSMARDAKIASKSTPAVAQAETRAAVREVVLSAERAGVGEAQAAGLAAEVRLWAGTWGGLPGGRQGCAGSPGRAGCPLPSME